MSDAPVYSCSPRVVATALADGAGVLLHLDTLFYFSLNPTGLVVWRALERGPATASALAAALVREFEVDLERAERDVQQLLDELAAERLVARSHRG